MKRLAGLIQFALRVEMGLAGMVLVMAIVVFVSSGLTDAITSAVIVFLVPQPFLLFAFWQASRKGLGGRK